jgi:hypothetical protein
MSCVVKGCGENLHKKAVLCPKHWHMVPKQLQMDVRKGTEKGSHSLRAAPYREWMSAISKYVGDVKAVVYRVDAQTNKINRKVQAKPEPLPA